MKLNIFFLPAIISLIVLSVIQRSPAQISKEEFIIPRTNSKSIIQQTIASTLIEVTYHRPNKRGRNIFGDLVPYDKVWRTGADEATRIYVNTPIRLAGNPVDSGQYELFTIPGEKSWEIILQKNQNQWGAYRYQPENDAVKFSVAPIKTEKSIETFTISIDSVGSDYGVLTLSWDHVVVPIEIHIDLRNTVIPRMEEALEEEDQKPYFQAAMFYFENNIDTDRAAELMALALERNPGHIGMLYRYALILKQKGDIPEAIKAAEMSLEGAQNAAPALQAEYVQLNSVLLRELKSIKN